ncbi:unnamed protein product [Bemisia tabaci]|uniref:Uncharacterized protein n=1 Tax=Bemisia tabaci TaxID=7038 RepID=A0A9P0A212_BEMTA|nr:unnamed protein product [Bemisia tabaci]
MPANLRQKSTSVALSNTKHVFSPFLQLPDLTPNGAALIIDEVQTGGGPTGKFWCHEHFNLPEAPDIVTFSKKMLTGGYYLKPQFL